MSKNNKKQALTLHKETLKAPQRKTGVRAGYQPNTNSDT